MRDATYLDLVICLGLIVLIAACSSMAVLVLQGASLPYEVHHVVTCATSGES